jgi:hypothetical protein
LEPTSSKAGIILNIQSVIAACSFFPKNPFNLYIEESTPALQLN